MSRSQLIRLLANALERTADLLRADPHEDPPDDRHERRPAFSAATTLDTAEAALDPLQAPELPGSGKEHRVVRVGHGGARRRPHAPRDVKSRRLLHGQANVLLSPTGP